MTRNLTGLTDADFDNITVSGSLTVSGTPTFNDVVVNDAVSATSLTCGGGVTTASLGRSGVINVACTNLDLTSPTNVIPAQALTDSSVQAYDWKSGLPLGPQHVSVGQLYRDANDFVKVRSS